MKKLILVSAIVLSLAGCSTTSEYAQYSKAQSDIATAKANSETARYNALAAIAKDGTDSARVAAVMALALGGNNSQAQQAPIAAPQRSEALQWASILIPSVTQVYSIRSNAAVAMNANDNAAATSIATTHGFVGLAGKIQAPAANVSTVTTTSTDSHNVTTTSSADQSMTGTGVLGSGSYATAANPTTTTTSSADQTMSGTGVLGSGTYSPVDNNSVTTNPALTTTVPAGKVCSVEVATGLVNCI